MCEFFFLQYDLSLGLVDICPAYSTVFNAILQSSGNVGLSALFQPSTSWRPNPFYNANSLTIINSDEREDNKREGDKSGSNAMELLTFDNDPERQYISS